MLAQQNKGVVGVHSATLISEVKAGKQC
ncbi:hypothetical protein PSEUDO9AZ_10732 [Pseudomonas sp. 9AZ]|nr:hypothetical protein PSEUDO9AZ_10732 [Pseudomonas sp. 9AZ]